MRGVRPLSASWLGAYRMFGRRKGTGDQGDKLARDLLISVACGLIVLALATLFGLVR